MMLPVKEQGVGLGGRAAGVVFTLGQAAERVGAAGAAGTWTSH